MTSPTRPGTAASVLMPLLLVVVVAAGCGGPPTVPAPRTLAPGHGGAGGTAVTDALRLDATTTTAGTPIDGRLVVVDPGAALDLGQGACRPRFVVVLTNRNYVPVVAWPTDCEATPLRIGHGTTSLAFTVVTTYEACHQPGTDQSGAGQSGAGQSGADHGTTPPCTASGPPPLPPGTYRAVVDWDQPVALPAPRPVSVTLRAGS